MTGMTGRSRVPPKGDALPLGTDVKKFRREAKKQKKVVASQEPIAVDLFSQQSGDTAPTEKETIQMEAVTLIRKPSSPKGQTVVFGIDGRRGSIRFSKTLFTTTPDQIVANIDGLAGPKVKETKEERKARLATQPKKTDADRLAILEAKTARMRERLAKKNAAAPVPVGV